MTTNQYPRSIVLLVVGSLLVISIVGGTMFGTFNEAKRSEQLSDFNQSLLAFNRQTHHAEMSNASQRNSDREPIGVGNTADTSQVVSTSEAVATTPQYQSPNVQPFTGTLDATREIPAFDWLDPAVSINKIVETARERGGNEDAYGWIQMRSDVKASRLQSLTKDLGVELVSSSPKYVRVKLPGDRDMLGRIADLAEVEGFGLMPSEAKTPAHLMDAFDSQSFGTEVPVFITTMGDDSDGSFRQRLIAMGATVGQWDPDIRTYLANLNRMTLDRVLEADFVEKVSPNALLRAHLTDVTGSMGADLHRTFTEAGHVWSESAGQGVTVGVMDTGINANHREFSDKTICTRSTEYQTPQSEIEARLDRNGHGSHVSGIAVASGFPDPATAGVAPGSKTMRVAKILTQFGYGDTLMFVNGVDFHTEADPCDDPATADPAPLVNVSVGGVTPETDGRSIPSRKMDAAAYHSRQNYVVSAGNSGALGPDNTPTTKSAVSVGMTTDSGVISYLSSHGPTADGRLLPHIVAPGNEVISAGRGGSPDEYRISTGTSMSTPAVTGLAAALIGANPELTDNPAAVRASLMAAAIKPRRWIGSSANMPTNNTHGPGDIQNEYGMGFASLVPHELDSVDHDVMHGEMNSDGMASTTITVPEGTARLDVVLAFNEPASPALDRTVLTNLDLYLDKDANCGGGACGEYSSKSEIDTVEWILIKDPAPGEYEVKVLPANAFDAPALFGVAWVMLEDDVPELSITSETTSAILDEGDRFEIDLNIGASGFVANAVTVHVMCRANPIPADEEDQDEEDPCEPYYAVPPVNIFDQGEPGTTWSPGSISSRGDGSTMDLAHDSFSSPIPVGAVTATDSKNLTLRLSGSAVGEVGSHTLYFVATSWNGLSDHHTVNVVVDGDANLPPRAIPPINDNIDQATALTGDSGVLQPDLILATREGGEPMLRDSFVSAFVIWPIDSAVSLNFSHDKDFEYVRNNSVWYTVDAPDKPTVLSFGSIPRDVGINVYRDLPAKSTMVSDNWNVPDPNGADGALTVNLVPNTRYYVQVYAHEDVGELMIPWVTGDPKPPANDHFANPQAIAGDFGSVSGTNFKASLEGFETYDGRISFSTWFSWTPQSSGAFRFKVEGDARIAIFSGSRPGEIRRVSTVPDHADHIYVYASEDETYRIVSLSRIFHDTLAGYRFEWIKVDKVERHASNDMFAMAADAGNSIRDNWNRGRTVEPGEPDGSGVASRWWKWSAPLSGRMTFTSNAVAGSFVSLFSGTDLSNLQLLASGTEFVVDVEKGKEYYVSIGRSKQAMFIDYYFTGIPGARVTWGPTPANDSRSEAIQLTGETNSVDFTHAFATLDAADGLPASMTHSLWWEWTAPETGWHQFATKSNPSRGAYFNPVDSVVILLDATTGRRIGTSDRSYLMSGDSEITFYAESGSTYIIQSALRHFWSRTPFEETTLSWGPVDEPPYSRFVGRYRDSDQDPDLEVAGLESPMSIATNEGGGKIFVNAAESVLVFDAVDVDTMPAKSNEVPYVDSTGASVEGIDDGFLYWDNTMDALYALAPDTIWLVNGYDDEEGHFESCAAIETNHGSITDAFTTSDGKFLYVLGLIPLPPGVVSHPYWGPFPEYEMSIFSRGEGGACELAHVQTLDSDSIRALETTSSFEASANSNHVYFASDNALITFERNETTGELTEVDSDSASQRKGLFAGWWRQSQAALASLAKDHLFVVADRAPYVAVYSLTDPADPQLVDSVAGYYANVAFGTFEVNPWPRFGCRIVGTHAASVAVDYMCEGELLLAELQESGRLRIMDAMYPNRQDRFGRELEDVPFAPNGMITIGVRPLSQNHFILNSGAVDSLAVFDHLKQIEGNPYD